MISLGFELRELLPLWQSLSSKRKKQFYFFQFLNISAGFAEIANLGSIFPFLTILSNPKENINKLGIFSIILRKIPVDNLLLLLGIFFIFFIILSSYLRIKTLKFKNKLASNITIDLSTSIYSIILERPYEWHIKNNSSKLLGNLTKDIDQTYFIISEILVLAVNLVIALCISCYLLITWSKLMIFLISFLVLTYLIIFIKSRNILYKAGKSISLNYEINLKSIQDSIAGIKDIIINKSYKFFKNSYLKSYSEYRNSVVTVSNLTQIPRYYFEAFVIILIILISIFLEFSGYKIYSQLPIIGTITLGFYKLLPVFQSIFRSISNIKSNMYSLSRLDSYLADIKISKEKSNILNDKNQYNNLYKFNDYKIRIDSLYFKYVNKKNVLNDINLTINQGEKVAIVGPSGSGKSTLGDIILGLLKPNNGFVYINDIDLFNSKSTLNQWQYLISHVPQFIYLSDSTIDANIAFGIPKKKIDKSKLITAIKKSQLEDVIENLPQGLETKIGERGIKLSGGQIQRIGIARSLYKMPKIILLDEATSSLDNKTEAEVMKSIYELSREITVIIIAHRLTTVKKCDKIFFLEKGKLEGIGSFDKLYKGNKRFKILVNKEEKFK